MSSFYILYGISYKISFCDFIMLFCFNGFIENITRNDNFTICQFKNKKNLYKKILSKYL